MSRRWASPLLAGLLTAFAPLAAGDGPPVTERDDEDLLVLELRLGHHVLHDALLAYPTPDGLLVPLQEVMTALELPIAVDPGSGTAEGWFLDEKRRFSLDLARREVQIAGRLGEYAGHLIELYADDVYVDTRLLARWFPVDFEIRRPRSRILIRSREQLPIERRLERQRKWRRSQHGARSEDGPRHPRDPLPYRWLDWPTVDHTVSISFGDDDSDETGQGFQSNLLATGDFLRMNAELTAGLGTRLRLGRRDPDAGLLGRLGATVLQAGDLYTVQRPLVSRQIASRGFEISSFPLDRPRQFDRKTLRGETLPGWEVELYHNQQLIDFQTVGSDSRYEFTDIPLYVGLNVLRLVFHGPQGQRRQRVERVLIGPDLIQVGESHYRFAVHQHDRHLFGPVDGPESEAAGEAAAGQGKPRYLFELERGLRRDLSLALSVDSLPLADGRHTYAGVGLLGTRKGILANLQLVADTEGGWAGRLAAEGRLPGFNLRLEHQRFLDFVSEEIRGDDPLTERSTVEIGNRLRPRARSSPAGVKAVRDGKSRVPVTLGLIAEQERYVSGASSSAMTARLGANLGRFSFSKTLQMSRFQRPGVDRRKLGGNALLAARAGRLKMRGGLRYELEPSPELRDFQLTAEWRMKKHLHGRINLRHSLSDGPPSSYGASLSWRLDVLALGLDARRDERGGLSSGLTVSYSLGREPHAGSWRSRSRPLAGQGLAAARVFLDRNLNQRFDRGDEPLEGVGLTADGRPGGRPTNRQGIAFILGLTPYRHTDLGLSLKSLEDPYWIPAIPGVGLVARPGRVATVDFPVVVSGEVDGTVYLAQGEAKQAISRVQLQLVDPRGEVRYRAASTFDGFYLFDRVVPGPYTLRVDPRQIARLGFLPSPERSIVVEPDGAVISGVDLVLRRPDLATQAMADAPGPPTSEIRRIGTPRAAP